MDYEPKKLTRVEVRNDGREQSRKTVGDDKLLSVASIAANSVTQAMMTANAIGKNEWKYEQVAITITGTSTSGTATVTTGSIPISYFLSAFTTPAASYVQLAVSGTTLTATLSTAPGSGNSITIQIVLLKN